MPWQIQAVCLVNAASLSSIAVKEEETDSAFVLCLNLEGLD